MALTRCSAIEDAECRSRGRTLGSRREDYVNQRLSELADRGGDFGIQPAPVNVVPGAGHVDDSGDFLK